MALTEYYKIVAAKLSALFAIGIVSFICGILPFYFIKAWRNRFPTSTIHKITSGVICFSGGSLLGVTFLHLLPEVREKIARLQSKGEAFDVSHTLPISDIIAMAGFFGVYVLDELMHLSVEWYSLKMRQKASEIKKQPKYCSQLPHEVSAFSLDKHENSKHQSAMSRRSNHHTGPVITCICKSPNLNPGDLIDEKEIASMTPSQGAIICCERRPSPPIVQQDRNKDHRHHPTMPQVSGLITIAALSFHDVFEGMAVGVEHDLSSILFLYLSIASHKYAIAFCIGMDLTIAGSRFKMIVLSMMAFSIVSPLGVVIGMIVVAQTDEENVDIDVPVSIVLQGIAGGTLIYVVCFEVLQREGTDTHTKGILNVLFVIVGFLVTLGFKVLLHHSHSD